jgi:hypothetical protein
MLSRLITTLGLIAGLYPAAAVAAERPVVVELYTSQGCSSCPPANAYLNELSRDRHDVLPLAFHVTYWDRLGWKDPYSLQAATDRQDQYGHRFGDGSYTPESGGGQVSIQVGSGSGTGKILLIGFDHDHTTAIGRGENSGRTLEEANIVRSFRSVGQWSGAPLQINERFPEGQDVAVVLEAPDGQIIGASRLSDGST